MEVFICIGSSCHLKGSYGIIQKFQELISKHHLEDQVSLSASFCLGNCTNGVTIKVDGRLVSGVNEENAEEIFNTYILNEITL